MQEQQTANQDAPPALPMLTFGQKAAIFATPALVSEAFLLLLHAPLPLEVAAVVGAFALAKKSPELLGELAPFLHHRTRTLAADTQEESGEWSMKDRLLGRHLCSQRRPGEERQEEEEEGSHFDEIGEDDMPIPHAREQAFLCSNLHLRPTKDRIFLARTPEGIDLFCTASELCHVAIAGNTGGGKTSFQRLLLAQLCKIGAQVLMLNPHYTRYDIEHDEDWTPFEPFLYHDPMKCRDYGVIEHFLKQAATQVIPRRLDRRARSQPVGKPYFIVIDELPSIVRHIPDAPEYMRPILEEGRKVGVYLISAAQDFLVRTIAPGGGGGGSIRECYRTAAYVGGDATTARVLLDMKSSLIPEAELGKGVMMLRAAPCKQARLVYVPYVDNQALYALLGPSTYRPEEEEDDEDALLLPGQERPRQESAPLSRGRTPPSPPPLPLPPDTSPLDAFQRARETNSLLTRERILETIITLADRLDEETMVRLINLLPNEREEEEEEPMTLLERGIIAYQEEGATSISKLAAALEIKPWEARNLLPKVQTALKREA